MKKIISKNNPEIIAISKLKHTKERREQQQYSAEGIRTCATLIDAGQELMQLFVTEPMLESAQKIVHDDHITLVTDDIMKKISQATSPSGVVGIFKLPSPPKPDTLTPGIVLAGISDPGNMGTLIRTCAAMGKKSVVVIEGVDPWNPKVIQASAGTIGLVTIFEWSLETLLKYKKSLKLYGLAVSGGKKPHEVTFNNALIVIGSEAHGIPPALLNHCDEKITLEMPGNIESLNAAIAGSIALYLAWHSPS